VHGPTIILGRPSDGRARPSACRILPVRDTRRPNALMIAEVDDYRRHFISGSWCHPSPCRVAR